MTHPLNHSAGLCLLDSHAHDLPSYSFVVMEGEIVDGDGWGFGGPVPIIESNPIDGPVHTILVDDLSDSSKHKILELVDQHRSRYKQCLIEFSPPNGALAQWAGSGLPAPDNGHVSTWTTDKEEEK